jgi:HEAT repeat protein
VTEENGAAGDSVAASLAQLFDADREARRRHDELVARGRGGGLDEVLAAIRATLDGVEGLAAEEASLRLVASARLLGEFEGASVADLLIDILDSDHAEARHEAGEQLQGLAFDRFKEVALATERALERFKDGAPALVELPYVLSEVPEGGVVKLLGKFLSHADADVVAAAIEAMVELGDPSAVKLLMPLCDDERRTTLADEHDADAEVSVGELAQEAVELLAQFGDE